MNRPEENSAPSQEQLLIMAVALHGAPPEIVRGERAPRACGMRIIRQVLIWQNCWTSHEDLYDEDGHFTHPVYPALIQLSREREDPQIVKGFGNLGSDSVWCSAPRYVSFGLTEAGSKLADDLFKQFPGFERSPDE